jgi:hypothetical protein
MVSEVQEMISLLAKINKIMTRKKEFIVQNVCWLQYVKYLDNFCNVFVISFVLYTHILKAF